MENSHCGESVGLLVTYRCNLNCVYCYIKKKRHIDMSIEQAQAILTPFLSKADGPLDIILMGGEPLLAESVIRQLVEWVGSREWNREYRFFGSTNGTLLSEGMKRWLERQRTRIVLALSYDGLPAAQMENRGCVSGIDVDFFIRTWPRQPIQMTINAGTVAHMAEGVIDLLEKGGTVHPNVAYEAQQWSRRALREYSRQLDRLAGYYRQHPEKPMISQFRHNLLEYAANLDAPPAVEAVCGAGSGFQVFDPDGNAYPCHILSPLVLDQAQLEELKGRQISFESENCALCPYVSNCPTCIGCNYVYRGSFQARDRTHCSIMKLEVRAFMDAEVRRLLAKETLTPEDALEIDAIRKIADAGSRIIIE